MDAGLTNTDMLMKSPPLSLPKLLNLFEKVVPGPHLRRSEEFWSSGIYNCEASNKLYAAFAIGYSFGRVSS